MAVTLRAAMVADIPFLEYWDTKPHVIYCSGANDTTDWAVELERRPDWLEIMIGCDSDRPIGVVQIIDPAKEESHYWGDVAAGLRAIDIWIGEEDDLGRGFGTLMMEQAIDRCFSGADVAGILIDPLASNTAAHRFYERLGFTFIERRRFDDDDCFVYKYTRDKWQAWFPAAR